MLFLFEYRWARLLIAEQHTAGLIISFRVDSGIISLECRWERDPVCKQRPRREAACDVWGNQPVLDQRSSLKDHMDSIWSSSASPVSEGVIHVFRGGDFWGRAEWWSWSSAHTKGERAFKNCLFLDFCFGFSILICLVNDFMWFIMVENSWILGFLFLLFGCDLFVILMLGADWFLVLWVGLFRCMEWDVAVGMDLYFFLMLMGMYIVVGF